MPAAGADFYDNAPCGYLTTRPDGTIAKVNETFLRWTGFDRADLVGRRRFRDLLSVGGRIYHETHFAPLLRMQGEVHEVALELVRADQRRLPILLNSVLQVDAEGAPLAIHTTVFNATERRSYERELMRARRAAEESESRVRVLQEVVAALSAAPTAMGVAQALVRAANPAFAAAGSAVWLLDRAAARLTVAATSGSLDDPGQRADLAAALPLSRTVRTRQVLVYDHARAADPSLAGPDHGAVPIEVDDVAPRDPREGRAGRDAGGGRAGRGAREGGAGRDGGSAERDAPEGAVTGAGPADRQGAGPVVPWAGRCALLAPLVVAGEALGVVVFGFAELREFTDSEQRLVGLLGEQAGQALDRARLYDEARQREARSAFLAATTRAMEEVRGLAQRAQRLVDRLVPEVADRACVRMGGADGVAAWAGFPPAGRSPAPPDLDWLDGPVAQVMAHGELRQSTRGSDGAWVVLPLQVRGRAVGTLVLSGPGTRRRDPEELRFLADLADRVGLTLENARLYDQEHQIAQTLQRSLLAGDPPPDPRFSVATHYRPATENLEVGGDWYDSFLITTDKLSIVVGDVVGRGIEAASAMGQLRSAIRALAAAELGPARLVERLDQFVERLETARMATVAYAEIDLRSGEMTYCCAGHLPPVLQEPDGAPRLLWGGRSAPLGSRAGRTARTEDRIRLAPGSRLLLYTDGLIERRDRTLDVGFTELAGELGRRRGAPLAGLTAELADVLVGPGRRDDVCLLLLSYGAAERLERSIAADVTQIAALRRELRGWLAANAVPEDSQEALLLACSEATANAIEHGCQRDRSKRVSVAATLRSDTVELCVRDEGSWRAPVADPVRGRGLLLIGKMMDEVTVERRGTGTTVTMRRRLTGDNAAGAAGAGEGAGTG
ncbi:MAG TPA: SpoIIE family protein phosphatase [Catenuloplanes sp.]